MVNKNRYLVNKVKKVLHKVKKQWVTISVALLGLLGVKSVATHVNVSANSAQNSGDSQQQLNNSSIRSADAHLTQSNGSSLTSQSFSASAQPATNTSLASSNNSVSANKYTLKVSSVNNPSVDTEMNLSSATHSFGEALVSHTFGASTPTNLGEKQEPNLHSSIEERAQNLHNNIINDGMNAKQHKLLGVTSPVYNQNNNSIISQALDFINKNVKNSRNSRITQEAYANFIGQFSNLSEIVSSKSVGQWFNLLQTTKGYLQTIASNGPSNSLLDKAIGKLNDIQNYGNFAIVSRKYNLNQIATDFDTPGGMVNYLLKNLVSLPQQTMDKIAVGMRIINKAATDSTLGVYYSKIITDLTNLPKQDMAQQALTLSDLSNNIKGFTNNIGRVQLTSNNSEDIYNEQQDLDPNTKNGVIDHLNNAVLVTETESTNLINANAVNSLLNSIHASTLFSTAADVLTNSVFTKHASMTSLVNAVKSDLKSNSSANNFIASLDNALTTFGGATASSLKSDISNLYTANSSEINAAYGVASANASTGVDSLLDDLADLSAGNAESVMNNVNSTITNNPSLNGIGSLADIATAASSSANSYAYDDLLNAVGPLYSAAVDRIVASGFNSSAFKTLIGSAEADLNNATTASSFVSKFTTQDSAFTGGTQSTVNSLLSQYADNPELNRAYQSVSASSSATDQILNDLSRMSYGMNTADEVHDLSDIATVTQNNFSNASLFGSIATATSNVATDAEHNQPTVTNQAINSTVNAFPVSEALSFVASKFASSGFSHANLFDTLMGQAKDDFDTNSNASEFLTSFAASAASDFSASDDSFINTAISSLESKPGINDTYTLFRNNQNATDSLFNDLASMKPANESNALSSLEYTVQHTPSFSSISAISNAAASAATDATSAETEQTVVKDLVIANNNVQNASATVTAYSNANTGLFADSASASAHDAYVQASDAARQASLDVTKFSDDAKEHNNGVSVDSELSVDTPWDVDDVNQIKTDVGTVNTDLGAARQDANEARVDAELNHLDVSDIFNAVLNYAIAHDDYTKIGNAASAAKSAFDNNGSSLSSFVDAFTSNPYVSAYTNGNANEIKSDLENHESDLNDAYQLVQGNKSAADTVLSDLSDLTFNNASTKLGQLHDDLAGTGADSVFKNLATLGAVAHAADVKSRKISSAQSEITSLVNGLVSQTSVKTLMQKLATAPQAKRNAFEHFVGTNGAQKYLNNDSTVTQFIHDFTNDPYFSALAGNTATAIKDFLTNPSVDNDVLNGYYGQIRAQKGDVDKIFDDLASVAKNQYQGTDSDALDQINSVITHNPALQSVPGFSNVARGAEAAKPALPNGQFHYASDSFNNLVESLIHGYIGKVADHLSSPEFPASEKSAFNSIIGDLETLPGKLSNHTNVTNTLNDINTKLDSFTGPSSSTLARQAQRIINDIEDHDSTPVALTEFANQKGGIEGALINDLNAGMQAVKTGSANNDYQHVLGDVAKIDQNPKLEDHYLKDIDSTINTGAGDLKNIPVLQSLASNLKHVANVESSKKHAIHVQRINDQRQQLLDAQRHSRLEAAKHQHAINQNHREVVERIHAQHMAARAAEKNRHSGKSTGPVAPSNNSGSSNQNTGSTPFTPWINTNPNQSSTNEPTNLNLVGHKTSQPVTTPAITVVNATNPNQLEVNQAIKKGDVAVVRNQPNYRWFTVKRTCLAHYHMNSVGQVKDYGFVLHKGALVRIVKEFRVTKGNQSVLRYEINVNGKNYFVTGNVMFTREAYYQPKDLKNVRMHGAKGNRYYKARIKVSCIAYDSPYYTTAHKLYGVRRGHTIKIKRLLTIGRKGDLMTRFELANGDFITSNKYFIELI